MIKKLSSVILFAIIPAGLFYSIALFGLYTSGFEIMEILRDPAQQSGASSLLGFLSSIGIWLWISSGAIAFFAAFSKNLAATRHQKELLILAGTLSMILAVDDFFMIHDRYVNQYICYAAYAVCAGALLFRHFKTIFEINGIAFLLAAGLLALSVFSDIAQNYIPVPYTYVQIFEEGFKFIGAASWLFFCCVVANHVSSSPNGNSMKRR
jgi:hypothetical protein